MRSESFRPWRQLKKIAICLPLLHDSIDDRTQGDSVMAKGMDKKKETKKKPEKTLKEKRAEKAAKKG